jgi:hypothetical protein
MSHAQSRPCAGAGSRRKSGSKAIGRRPEAVSGRERIGTT